jgi:hypothetical protein
MTPSPARHFPGNGRVISRIIQQEITESFFDLTAQLLHISKAHPGLGDMEEEMKQQTRTGGDRH